MSKIKAGSRKQKENLKKKALKNGNKRRYIKLDFSLFKRRKRIFSKVEMWQVGYKPPFEVY